MFNKTLQRNFEWFEITFTKKMQAMINEHKEDSLSWIRDTFISLLLTILSLAFQLLENDNGSEKVQMLVYWGTTISIVGLAVWFLVCAIRYNKKIKGIKTRIIPHSSKDNYSIMERVELFDNDICNDLVLSKNYIDLAMEVSEPSLKEFYLIESMHYYFKSIRIFNIICNLNELNDLFTTESGVGKKINILRLQNYLELVKCIRIDESKFDTITIQRAKEYRTSYDLISESFKQTLMNIKNKYSTMQRIANLENDIAHII